MRVRERVACGSENEHPRWERKKIKRRRKESSAAVFSQALCRVVPEVEAYLASDVDPRRAGVGVNAASRRRVAWWGKRKCGRDGERPEIARRVCLPVRTVVVAFACRGSRHAPVRSASTTRVGSLHCTRHISPSPSRSRASRSRASSHARTAFACCEQREFKSLGAFRERAARVFVTGRTAKHFSR